MRKLLAGILSILLLTLSFSQPVYADDTTPPTISGVQVTKNSDTSVDVTWTTSEKADAVVNYGLQPDYGIVRTPGATTTAHSIQLNNLEPGRIYYFRVVSSDPSGNQGISAAYKFQTGDVTPNGTGNGNGNSAAQGSGQGQGAGNNSQTSPQTQTQTQTSSTTVTQIQQQIQQIQNVQQLKEILKTTQNAIQGITSALTIVGPPTVIPETTTATVKWTTDRDSDSVVEFSPTDQYAPDSYAYSQSSTDAPTQDHQVQLIGLQPYTEYHFKVKSTDASNITGESKDFTFTTKATLPTIQNLRILKVQENSATLAWDTPVPAKATVEYTDLSTGKQNSVGRPTLATNNQMQISNLTLGTRYLAFAIAENAGGDRVKSQPITFVTVKDTAPPIITNVTNSSTLFPGSDAQVQSIVEWRTDEPAYCTLTYREGVAGGAKPTVVEPDDKSFLEKHVVVITDFAPGTVYQFWLNCNDPSNNKVQSENYVLFTPSQEKNIIDLILQNFQSTFGWVKNIGGGGGG